MTYWIDTHCHMNEEGYRDSLDEYMTRAWENNVHKCIVIAMNKEELEYTFQMQEKYPFIDIAFGYHPEDAGKLEEGYLDILTAASKDDRVIAIGEIGLDYYWDKTFKQEQKDLFVQQIEIANKVNKPILIHSRSAAQDTYDILKEHAKTNVLLHCFGESYEMMQEYLKLGYYVAFGGAVTFKNSKVAKRNALEVPLDRLMIETDCPYMTPVPYRGKRNETAYVRYVGEFICELRKIPVEDLQQQLMDNFQRFFNGKD